MLSVTNLKAETKDHKEILCGLEIDVKAGEVHAIMGPNGSGKSTFANVLAGHPDYAVTQGEIIFNQEMINELSPEQRAEKGIFLAFQYPVEIPGVNNAYFLQTAVNSLRKKRGENELDAYDFMQQIKSNLKLLDMDEKFLKRSLNEGFSGGEKKRNEILQLLMLAPKLAILDETDSGLDIDALQIVARGVNHFKQQADSAVILVTHYQRLLDYIVPDYVHVLANGKIIKSGDKSLALELEQKGYGWLTDEN